MKLSDVFYKASKDILLIKMTVNDRLNDDIKKELSKNGWREEVVPKYIIFGDTMPVIYIEEVMQFKKGPHIQGDPEWYNDLSSICIPKHRPGLLTKIFG